MPKAPAAITSLKIKKLAKKAFTSPSMLTTVETRELGASVLAFISPPKEVAAAPAKKTPAKTAPAKSS
jgi:ABC-type enterochelin transport system permease subunit